MRPDLAKAYASVRKHEVGCVMCSNAGYQHLCPIRAPLWQVVQAIDISKPYAPKGAK